MIKGNTNSTQTKPLLGLHQILYSTIPRYLPLLVLTPEETYTDLLHTGSSVVAAFDSAVSAMYPEQDREEIETAIDQLNERSRKLATLLTARLDRVSREDEKRVACRLFLGKWEDRLEKEVKTWSERSLSVKSLEYALPK